MQPPPHPTLHILEPLWPTDRATLRLVLPGLDRGGAVWFEYDVSDITPSAREALARSCAQVLGVPLAPA